MFRNLWDRIIYLFIFSVLSIKLLGYQIIICLILWRNWFNFLFLCIYFFLLILVAFLHFWFKSLLCGFKLILDLILLDLDSFDILDNRIFEILNLARVSIKLILHLIIRVFQFSELVPNGLIVLVYLTLRIFDIGFFSGSKLFGGLLSTLILLVLSIEVPVNLSGQLLQGLKNLRFLLLKLGNILRLPRCSVLEFRPDDFLSGQ